MTTDRDRLIDICIFFIFIVSYILFFLSANFLLLGIIFFGLMVYEIKALTNYSDKQILSIKLISYEQFLESVLYATFGGIVSGFYILVFFIIAHNTTLDFVVHQYLENISMSITYFDIIWFALLSALVEEFLFRHFCQGRLLDKFSKYLRILLPTLVFVYIHTLTYASNLSGILMVTGLVPTSLSLSIIYEKTRSILPVILLHFIANCFVLLIFATFNI